ncbi:MAG: hypothetical protein GY950_33295 [bacterium]|nr:hypothetical protein [bacterium]
MTVLLMVYDNIRFAVDMAHVSAVINMARTKIHHKDCLWKPTPEQMGVRLKNGFILPAAKVEEMTTCPKAAAAPNHFLKGCMKNGKIDRFILVNNRIYGMLSAAFLFKE